MTTPDLDVVTGAFSYTGAEIARRLLDQGRRVRTLTFHPDRPHPIGGEVEAVRYRFESPSALAESLQGAHTLYNTYWVRFDRGASTHATAVANSKALFEAAGRAGVERIVHVSITHPSAGSPLPYFRGKALVERALADAGVGYAIVRPTWIFGGEHEILANNIAWILRRMPLIAIPGNGQYLVQPVHVADMARICVEAARARSGEILDAAGPQQLTYIDLVRQIRTAVGARRPIVPLPPAALALSARLLGLLVRDVVLTKDEIAGLSAGLLISNQPPLGTISFSQWLHTNRDTIGRRYANELRQHYLPAT